MKRIQTIALLTVALLAMTVGWQRLADAADLAHPRQQRDLTPALRERLTATLSDEASNYLNAEDDKKSRNETYVDLQPQFEYLPNYGPGDRLVVSAKLGGAEYNPPKTGVGKGTATGKLKYLVFTYRLSEGKWVEVNKPRWETQDLGSKAARKMTAAAEREEKYKAAQAQAEERRRQKAHKTPAPTRTPVAVPTPAKIS